MSYCTFKIYDLTLRSYWLCMKSIDRVLMNDLFCDTFTLQEPIDIITKSSSNKDKKRCGLHTSHALNVTIVTSAADGLLVHYSEVIGQSSFANVRIQPRCTLTTAHAVTIVVLTIRVYAPRSLWAIRIIPTLSELLSLRGRRSYAESNAEKKQQMRTHCGTRGNRTRRGKEDGWLRYKYNTR